MTLAKTTNTTQLILWRDSVCAGDDCDAPHELALAVGADSLGSFIKRFLAAGYLPSISGGNATWILKTERHTDRALAVIAQQWAEPRFLVAADADVLLYINRSAKEPHLYLRYWCQVDPETVFQRLERNESLPVRYGR
ncbi:MAG: hypothetical protein WAM44_05420 [Chthoniobacterales bacterium]